LKLQIQISHIAGVNNGIADALSRLSRAGDYIVKPEIFQITCETMGIEPTIDLFSQHFNHLLPRFVSTSAGNGEEAVDALEQVWTGELPWIHPPIPLISTVLNMIKRDKIQAMVIAPMWPGQVWFTELVRENIQFLILG
jgi:hypothetical protein